MKSNQPGRVESTAARRAPRVHRISAALLVPGSLLLLNGLLSFEAWWPTPAIVPTARLAPEFVALWLTLLALVAWRTPVPRAVVSGLALVYLVLMVGRYAEVMARSLFGRPVNLYWDGAQLPRFLWVSMQDWGPLPSVAVLAVLGLAVWALFRGLRGAIDLAAHGAAARALRSPAAGLVTGAAVLLVLTQLGQAGAAKGLASAVSPPVTPTVWRQAVLLATAWSPERTAAALPASTAIDAAMSLRPGRALTALAGRDVYLLMLESYGAVVYDDARAAQALQPLREQWSAAITAGGHQVVSAFVRSPAFGGASDLAHLSLLSGIDLHDPARHDLLLTTDRPTLMSLFRREGYQTFGVYPAVSWEWPERAYYRFDVYLDGPCLDYQGPALGGWKIPDQFAWARFEQQYPRQADAPPRFVFFATINTHIPFAPLPPYQPDGQRLLTATPFDEADTRRALARTPDWLDPLGDYIRAFDYTYRWLAGAWRTPPPRETVWVIVGDHQPVASVTGESSSWDVPVHIVARDPALLARLVAQGFQTGLEPPRAAIGTMHDLTALLVRSFGDEAAALAANTP